ncbi:hypothetical protein H9L12_10080 [Sphingomonas rhizophila]|uniref:Peptidase C1A papain C-terminal domain-containing protein n=1 Tax=Sphingomonas rhizophila TaxID=2071607 RepID=A0A7G9S9V2_9SPHN|nr:C1 family peptidase [Sphingomonas rhizophila]QNN64627.1 hypothetical protein H9L12_10080 [Sphingomonas rhizophila]
MADLLSPESLHRAAAYISGLPVSEAMSVNGCLAALDTEGQTTETDWPYNSPASVNTTAKYFTRKGYFEKFDAPLIEALVRAGMPIGVVLNIGLEFFRVTNDMPLEVTDALPVQACHALIISGFRTTSGKCYFRLKNSWGPGWGRDGHAWASANYLALRSPGIIRLT